MTSILNYDQAAHEQALHDDGFEEGREEGVLLGTLKAIQGLMKNMDMSLEKALDALEITGKDRDTIAKALKG